MCTFYDKAKPENYYHEMYGYYGNMTRVIFIVWLFCVSFEDLGNMDLNEITQILLEFINTIKGEEIKVNTGYEILVQLHKLIGSNYDDQYRYNNVWNIDIQNDDYIAKILQNQSLLY